MKFIAVGALWNVLTSSTSFVFAILALTLKGRTLVKETSLKAPKGIRPPRQTFAFGLYSQKEAL